MWRSVIQKVEGATSVLSEMGTLNGKCEVGMDKAEESHDLFALLFALSYLLKIRCL